MDRRDFLRYAGSIGASILGSNLIGNKFVYANEIFEILPDVEAYDLEGNKVKLRGYLEREKDFYISFFTTWCKPCKEELAKLNLLKKEGNIEAIGICPQIGMDHEDRTRLAREVAKIGQRIDTNLSIDLLISNISILNEFGLVEETDDGRINYSFPQLLIYDPQGRLRSHRIKL